jgi:hypothetical protein
MTLAIAHREGETEILDVIREHKPPFSPEAVVEEFASLIRSYRCSKVYGDRYGGEWPREQFSKRSSSRSRRRNLSLSCIETCYRSSTAVRLRFLIMSGSSRNSCHLSGAPLAAAKKASIMHWGS